MRRATAPLYMQLMERCRLLQRGIERRAEGHANPEHCREAIFRLEKWRSPLRPRNAQESRGV
ncbi:hypothetical protein [Nannocystis pusilla]|uniref:hypothetical protein n=1 Tax=Nannocystis pusilla TaxID=889268 RepID=UPI003DA42A92